MSITFEQWMTKVDDAIDAQVGMTSADLPDCDWWNWWNDGVSAQRAAARAIKNAGGY